MDGAFGLKKGVLHGDILLNLDSEEEGELYVGCAGGVDANITFKYKAEPTPARNYRAVKLVVKGLKGGHSGIQIVEQRANANKLLFRFIREQKKSMDILLCSVDGGGLRNAIPREATATLMVRTKDLEQLTKELKAYEKVVKAEFAGIEDAVSIKLTETETPETMIAKEVAEEYGISPKRSASLLDTFSCIFQGTIPYGAQMLVAISTCATLGYTISAFDIIPLLF